VSLGPTQGSPPRRSRNLATLPLTSQATWMDSAVMPSPGYWISARDQSGTGDQKSPRSGIEAHSLGIEKARRHEPPFEALAEMLEIDEFVSALEAAFDEAEGDRVPEMSAQVAAGDISDAALSPCGTLDRMGTGRNRRASVCQDADQLLAVGL